MTWITGQIVLQRLSIIIGRNIQESNTGKIKKTHIQFQTYLLIVTNTTIKKKKINILLSYQTCIPAIIFES